MAKTKKRIAFKRSQNDSSFIDTLRKELHEAEAYLDAAERVFRTRAEEAGLAFVDDLENIDDDLYVPLERVHDEILDINALLEELIPAGTIVKQNRK